MSALTCRDVYTAALAMISEPLTDPSRRADFDERAPYLIAAMCDEARAMDAVFRRACDEEAQQPFSPVCLELTAAFPLTERFAAPAATYVAAMLVLQTMVNVGMCLVMFPVIGITLPFVSAGGSSVLATYIIVGMVHSVRAGRSKFYLDRK